MAARCANHPLLYTGDDAVAVKSTNYGGEVRNCCDITVTDLLAINNSATAKVGTETMAEKMGTSISSGRRDYYPSSGRNRCLRLCANQ